MLTAMALSLFKMLDNMATPCSVILIEQIYPLLMLSPHQAALMMFSITEVLIRPSSLE